MSKTVRNLILILTALALAVSPLRGALALPVMAVADDTNHCDQMQMAMPSQVHTSAIKDSTADTRDAGCDRGCGGDCCDGACNACAQGSMALSTTLAVTPDMYHSPLVLAVSHSISGRTVHPPFRPPISLPG